LDTETNGLEFGIWAAKKSWESKKVISQDFGEKSLYSTICPKIAWETFGLIPSCHAWVFVLYQVYCMLGKYGREVSPDDKKLVMAVL
jgi:hypothetical protein